MRIAEFVEGDHHPLHRLEDASRTGQSSETRLLLAMVEAEVGSLVELLPAPVLVTTEAGTVLRANPAAAIALEMSQASLIGQPVDDLLPRLGASARMRTLCHSSEVLRLYVV